HKNMPKSGSDKTAVRKTGKETERIPGRTEMKNSGRTGRNAADKSAMRTSGNALGEKGRNSRESGKKKKIRNIHKKKADNK
ncbi:MAG: hypothetical protein K2L18_03335, partial [Acetatifactor sp.]|nr:hypothetical protein [Acetatifactor sp.]